MSDEYKVLIEEVRDLIKEQNGIIASIAESNKRAQEDNAKSLIVNEKHIKQLEELKSAEVRNNLIFLSFIIFIMLFVFVAPKFI